MRSFNVKLIRHGEPEQVGVLLGHTDIHLSLQGVEQLILSFQPLEFGRLISSPLKRCAEFAEQVAAQRGLQIEIEPQIKEMNFGDWDGLSYQTLWQQSPSIGDFWQNPERNTPPNGETLTDFNTRVNQWWQFLITNNDQDIVVLTHAGVIKQVLSQVVSNDLSNLGVFKVNYAGVVSIDVAVDEQQKAWPTLVF